MHWRPHELRLYGHRGASARRPENTLAAFHQAVEDGATALEIDVHRTADDHLVVAHDPDGRRLAGTSAKIRDLQLVEVKRWRLADRRDGGEARHTVPTLDELLGEFPATPVSLDIKPDDPRAVLAALRIVAARGAEQRVTIGSFHDRLVRLVRRLGYAGATALTRREVAAARLLPLALSRRLVRGDAAMIPRRGWGIRLDGRAFVARCRRLGLRVDYWVVNEPAAARALLAAGATGLITDDPRAVAPVVAEIRRST